MAMELVNCPWCDGDGTKSSTTCPACGGEKLVSRRVAKCIKALQGEEYSPKSAMLRFAFEIIAGMRQADAQQATLAELPVPASFTNHKPDTPESLAAKEQLAISRGKAAGAPYSP